MEMGDGGACQETEHWWHLMSEFRGTAVQIY